MTTHHPAPWPREAEPDESVDTPILRLVDHAIGLWRAAQDLGDPVVIAALRPLVIDMARALARDALEGVGDETAH